MKKLVFLFILSLLFIIPTAVNADSFDCPSISGYKLSDKWNGEISFNDFKGWYTGQCSYIGSSGEIEIFAKANWVQDASGDAIPCSGTEADRVYSGKKQVFVLFSKSKEAESKELINTMMKKAESLALSCGGGDEFEEDAFEEEGDTDTVTICLMVAGGDCFDIETKVDPESDMVMELDKFCKENPDDTVMCGKSEGIGDYCLMTSPPKCWNSETGKWEDGDDFVEDEPIMDNFCLMTDPPQCWNKEKEAWEEVEDYGKEKDVGRLCIMTDPPQCWNDETGKLEEVEDYDSGSKVKNFCLMTDPPQCWDDKNETWTESTEKEEGIGSYCLMTDPPRCWDAEKGKWTEDYIEENNEPENICIMTDPPKCWDDKGESWVESGKKEKSMESYCLMTDPPRCWDAETGTWSEGEKQEEEPVSYCLMTTPKRCWNGEKQRWEDENGTEIATQPASANIEQAEEQPGLLARIWAKIWGWITGLFK